MHLWKGVDLLETKSRIAEALVESLFRRARYQVNRFNGDPSPLRFAGDDLSPDFRIVSNANGGDGREFLIKVKYRPQLDQFISVENQRGNRSMFFVAHRQWPRLYFVLVTDRPEPGRSCFQAIAFGNGSSGDQIRTLDLLDLKEIGVAQGPLKDYEETLRRIFGLLTAV